jgi:Phosphotransferase enzyme family
VSETVLEGGDLNHVVRIGDTVRRPQGEWSPAVHALLDHFEAVGFDGAPRFLGVDDAGREVLRYVEGDAALAPIPTDDEVLAELGLLLRHMHEAVADFEPPPDARWFTGGEGPLVCHRDLFPPNVILREGQPVALVDWDFAGPAERLDAYGLSGEERARFVDRAVAMRKGGYELHKRLGGEERCPGWSEMWDAGGEERFRNNLRVLEELRPELEAALA